MILLPHQITLILIMVLLTSIPVIRSLKEVDEHKQNDHNDNSEEFDDKGKFHCRHVCYTACQFVNCADGECPENLCQCIRCVNGTAWHIGDLLAGLGDDARHRLERELPKGAIRFLLRATAASIIGK